VYNTFGLPVEGLGLLLSVDLVPDMVMMAADVTADMTVATLLSRSGG
jgi:Na+/H+-dicarboxylate symporter